MRPLPLTFTGSAEGLRRHTRRDLLINIVLGGLYTPVARRHAQAYLATHTSLDGAPFVQAPTAHSRWPAILLVAAFVALRLASESDLGPPLPVVIAAGVLLIPYLWAAVTARSVGALRWRQMHPWFHPPWAEVYRQSWPLLVLGAGWSIAQPWVATIAPSPGSIGLRWLAGSAAVAAIALPLLARQAFNYHRLRFTRTRVGGSAVAWEARFAAFLRLWLCTAVAILLTAVAPVLLLREALFGPLTDLAPPQAAFAYLGAMLLALLLSVPARAWYEARVFVLTWNGVRVDDRIRIACSLDVRAFVATRTRDAWRTFITAGVHHPRAVVHAYQAKLAALTVWAA